MTVLLDQLELLERELAQLKQVPSINRAELETLLDVATGSLSSVFRNITRWKERIRTGHSTLSLEDGNAYHRLLRQWGNYFDALDQQVLSSTKSGLSIDPDILRLFRHSTLELRTILSISVDELLRVDQDVRHGRARPLSTVIDELRHRRPA